MAITYRDAGVDIDAAGDLVGRIAKMAKRTRIPEQLGGIGGFAGLCAIPAGMKEPILVSGGESPDAVPSIRALGRDFPLPPRAPR